MLGVDDEFELGRLQARQISRLGAFEATRCECWISPHHVTRTPALPLMVIRCSPAIEPK